MEGHEEDEIQVCAIDGLRACCRRGHLRPEDEDVRADLVHMSGGAHNRLVGVTLQNAGAQGADITGTDDGVQYALVRNVGNAPLAPLMGGAYELTNGAFFRNDCDM